MMRSYSYVVDIIESTDIIFWNMFILISNLMLTNNMNNVQKSNNIKSLLMIIPIAGMLLVSGGFLLQDAYAVNCSTGDHCHSVAQKTASNLGGYAKLNVNTGNTVEWGSAIVNSVWVAFSDGTWLESGWQKGNSMSPCLSTVAYFFVFDGIAETGTCGTTASGSTVLLQVSDVNDDAYWGMLTNGVQKDTVYKNANGIRVDAGGESTDEDNVLDNGRAQNMQYATTSGSWTNFASPGISTSTDASYTVSWNTNYVDIDYDGP